MWVVRQRHRKWDIKITTPRHLIETTHIITAANKHSMQKSKQQIKIEQLLKEAERESSSSKRQDLILQMIRLLSEIS